MKSFLLSALALVLFSSTSAHAVIDFPSSPNPALTPGSLCDQPDSRRYPEGIAYCSRDVASSTKKDVMRDYDQRLGFRVTQMNRADFKIDHYIPLCMGGSNREDNLWPQHKSIYQYTDQLEEQACLKMAAGKLRQSEAIEIIKRAKSDPANLAGPALARLRSL